MPSVLCSCLLWKKSSLLGGEQLEGVRDKADEKKQIFFLGGERSCFVWGSLKHSSLIRVPRERRNKRKEEGTGNVQWKSCIILPWHFLFLVRFNSRSEGVFSFPCLVENRCTEDISLRKAVAWGSFGKLSVLGFLLSLCSIREARGHRMATALCVVPTPELCRVPVHFDWVWVMLSYIWGEEWPKYITPLDSGVLLWSLCQCRAVAIPVCCLWFSMSHIV